MKILEIIFFVGSLNYFVLYFRRSRDNSLGAEISDSEIPSILKRRVSSEDLGLEVSLVFIIVFYTYIVYCCGIFVFFVTVL